MRDYNERYPDFSVLKGKTITAVNVIDRDVVHLMTLDGQHYTMSHMQDCCENVMLEDVCGDWADIIDSPVLLAEKVSNADEPEDVNLDNRYRDNAEEWTFYKLSTIKGSITLRWYGASNGYYSTDVSFVWESD